MSELTNFLKQNGKQKAKNSISPLPRKLNTN